MRGMTSSDGKMTGNIQSVGSYDKHKGSKGGGGVIMHGDDADEGHSPIKSHTVHKHADGHISSEDQEGNVTPHDTIDDAAEHMKMSMDDGEHDEMNKDSEGRAGARDAMEKHPKQHAPSFMD